MQSTAIQPGIYANISNADYHGGPGISKSGLDLINRAPATYHHVVSQPQEARTPTPAQRIGTAVHALILEPEEFAKDYCLALSREDVPHAIDDREQLVAMVEALNAERVAAHPDAIRGSEQLVAMIQELNKDRLPKLSTSGKKDALIARIVSDIHGNDTTDLEVFEGMKAGDLKEVIEAENARRPGLLSTGGDRQTLAETLRDNGVEVELWSEICANFEAMNGTSYTMGTSASRTAMAEWLNANGHDVTLWSDVKGEWDANNGHRIVLTRNEWDQIHGMRDAVMAHPSAGRLLRQQGLVEHSVYWHDPETGVLCRCRPDFWVPPKGLHVDLKTTDDASPEGFGKSIAKWRYHTQHPYYLDGCNHAIRQSGRVDLPEQRFFVFVAVEKAPPYNVGVYTLDDDSITVGTMEYRSNLTTYAQCLADDSWPAYSDRIESVALPEWQLRKLLPTQFKD